MKETLSTKPSLDQLSGKSVFPIVGIGASAGGLEAFKQLLEFLPIDTGLAFVIVQHLDPTHESILSDILARMTQMPIQQVKDGMIVKANHIYVVPPNVNMSMEGEVLRLLPRQEMHSLWMPIDHFFRSLAQNHGNRAIGMIFSGTGSDGALGLEEIKDRGGITFVQDPKTAKFSGMPQSAISTSAVDFVLPVQDIVRELMRISSNPYVTSLLPLAQEEFSVPPPIDQGHLSRIFKLLRASTGIDFTYYKHNTILRRITRRIALKKMQEIQEYADYLSKNPEELKTLYHDLLIKVTGFFRDPETFELLQKTVIPRILKNHSPEKPIRIWVPGCASGEEVYSLGICFLEVLDEKNNQTPIQIFATDIDEAALQRARMGIYIENIALDISPGRLLRFFSKINHNYRV